MTLFKIIYWAGLLIEVIVRAPVNREVKTAEKIDRRVSLSEKLNLSLLTLGSFVFPLIYSLTHWLDFANYMLPLWLGWLGVLCLAAAVFIFARAHLDLKSNWSPSLEIYRGHTLITNGIYGYIRHPMYASQWLFAVGQLLVLQNWLAGPLGLMVFIPFYLLRVQAEEKMMLERFGDPYRQYMQKTGRVIPKFARSSVE